MDLKKLVRDIPDFPKPGIVFKDIMPLIGDPQALKYVVDAMFVHYFGKKIDKVVSAEARGFIFGPAVAYHLGAGFVAVRKPGKLPYKTVSADYALEYGAATIDISLAMGELALLPAARQAGSGDVIIADGVSCRHQIHDGAQRNALHVVRLLADALSA